MHLCSNSFSARVASKQLAQMAEVASVSNVTISVTGSDLRLLFCGLLVIDCLTLAAHLRHARPRYTRARGARERAPVPSGAAACYARRSNAASHTDRCRPFTSNPTTSTDCASGRHDARRWPRRANAASAASRTPAPAESPQAFAAPANTPAPRIAGRESA